MPDPPRPGCSNSVAQRLLGSRVDKVEQLTGARRAIPAVLLSAIVLPGQAMVGQSRQARSLWRGGGVGLRRWSSHLDNADNNDATNVVARVAENFHARETRRGNLNRSLICATPSDGGSAELRARTAGRRLDRRQFSRHSAGAVQDGQNGTFRIATDSAAGLLWREVSRPMQIARTARWRWRVDEGVVPTDLTKRGFDDRALGVYFVFSDRPDVPKSPMAIFDNASVTALAYVFGGDKPRGTVVESPHMRRRGKFIVLRAADAPKHVWYDESVDLAQDYLHIFGKPLPNLIAIAIESDSDDTQDRNRAELQNFIVGE